MCCSSPEPFDTDLAKQSSSWLMRNFQRLCFSVETRSHTVDTSPPPNQYSRTYGQRQFYNVPEESSRRRGGGGSGARSTPPPGASGRRKGAKGGGGSGTGGGGSGSKRRRREVERDNSGQPIF
eukprot:854506_1